MEADLLIAEDLAAGVPHEAVPRRPLTHRELVPSQEFHREVYGSTFHGRAERRFRRWRAQVTLVSSLALAAVLALALVHRWRAASARMRGSAEGAEEMVEVQEDSPFCGEVMEDMEFHTSSTIYWVGNIQNQDICCAECDAHPECRAWTYGKEQGIDGLAQHCYLRRLEEGEEPEKVRRKGVVSGLLSHKLKKHGIVAEMLADMGAYKSRRRAHRILANETCAGPLNLTGYGVILVVSAKWLAPGVRASLVDVPFSNWAVIPHLGSRAYFASSCTPGRYDYSQYVALKLLGGSIRYTADVSRVGCGCNAKFHLVPMCQNMDQSRCGDFTCGHGPKTTCGALCAEIVLQDANQYAWSSSIHASHDDGGVSGGFGGGTAVSIGRRDWTDAQYGPGAECIDTTWPFEVEVAFPVDGEGNLKSVEVTLTQANRNCPLRLHFDHYEFGGLNGLRELSEVLRLGVTPSIGYDRYGDLSWLDGAGKDARGPCVEEVPEACPAAVRFYDFAVRSATARKKEKPRTLLRTRTSSMDAAIQTLHEEVAKRAREKELSAAAQTARAEAALSTDEPCPDGCKMGSLGGSGGAPHAGGRRFVQKDAGNTEWEVLRPNTKVWSSNISKTRVVRELKLGHTVSGERFGDWVKLAREPGYVLVKLRGETLLKERRVTYEKIVGSSCADSGLFPIFDEHICQTAAWALTYFDSTLQEYHGDGSESRPAGCHLVDGQLWMTKSWSSTLNGVMVRGEPICTNKGYATTTHTSTVTRTETETVTTTTRTSSTWTVSSTTTTTTVSSTTTATTFTRTVSLTRSTTTLTTTTWTSTTSTSTITTATTTTHTTVTTSVTTSTMTTTWGWPSLFCVQVTRAKGYELPLVKEQLKRRASVFSCDEYSIFSDGGVSTRVGFAPDGSEIKTTVIPAIHEAIGDLNKAGETTNSWLNTKTFLQVWTLAWQDGRLLNHDWTVKVDPDAVFFPDRLRKHVEQHTYHGAKLYVMNCNRFNPVALYGSVEVFSKGAMQAYHKGAHKCRSDLPWHGWGEDFFMSHCLDMLGVGRINDFGLLSDKRCFYRPCWDKTRVVYHDYKDANPHGAWFTCWNQSGGPWNPGG